MSKKYYSEEQVKELIDIKNAYKQRTTHEFYEKDIRDNPALVLPSLEVSADEVLDQNGDDKNRGRKDIISAMHTYGTQLLAQCVAQPGETLYRKVRNTKSSFAVSSPENKEEFRYEPVHLPAQKCPLSDFPENYHLYKDSGLWQMRSDDMETVLVQQTVNESDEDFFNRCKSYTQQTQ